MTIFQSMIEEINAFLESSNATLKEADELLNLAKGALIDAAVTFEVILRFLIINLTSSIIY